MEILSSNINEKVKFVKSLHDKKTRDSLGLFFTEGVNILSDLSEDAKVHSIYVVKELCDKADEIGKRFGAPVYFVTENVMKVMSDTVTPSGILAVLEIPKSTASGTNAIVLDGVQDSGNLGTIIRTAVGAGFFDVYLLDCADAYSPKTVRSSMGAVFRSNILNVKKEDIVSKLQDYETISMDMSGENIFSYKPTGKVALFLGNEAHGLSEFSKQFTKKILSIPMKGGQESLNVAVAAGIAMYVINNNR